MRGGAAIIICFAAVACHTRPSAPGNHKPVAPVDIAATSRALGGGEYEVTVHAVPTVDVRAVEIEVLVPDGGATVAGNSRAVFGATRAGTRHSHTVRVVLGEGGASGPGGAIAVGSARVTLVPGLSPNKITEVILGTPQRTAPPTIRVVTLPSGERIDEVRP